MKRVKRDSFSVLYYDYKGASVPILTIQGSTPDLESLRAGTQALLVRVGARNFFMVIDAIVAEESVVRDYENARRVFTKSLGRDVPFVFPPSVIR